MAVSGRQLYAQLHFRSYTHQQGLVNNEVNCTYRDSRGFLWIGTRDGLSVFNGLYFKNILYSMNDSTGLPGNNIRSLAEDDRGYIWVNTDRGICKIHPGNHSIKRYVPGKGMGPDIVHGNGHVLNGPEQSIYYTTASGLLKLDNDSFQLVCKGNLEGKVCIDHQGNLVVSHEKIMVINLATYKTGVVDLGEKNKDHFFVMYQDETNRYWLGSWACGLVLCNRDWKVLQTYRWDLNPANPHITNIAFCANGDASYIYVATSKGLLLYPQKPTADLEHPVAEYHHEPGISNGLSSTGISHIYMDAFQNLWLSTGYGLNVNSRLNRETRLAEKELGMISEHTWYDHRLITTSWYGKGLSFYDKNFTRVKNRASIPEYVHELDNTQISGMDREGNGLWVATLNGLALYDLAAGKTVFYAGRKNNFPYRLNDVWVHKNTHEIWCATYDDGLVRYNPATGKTIVENQSTRPEIHSRLIWQFYDDHHGNLYILCDYGLTIYNYHLDTWSSVTHIMQGGKQVELGGIQSVYTDKNNILWVGTDRGLFTRTMKGWIYMGMEEGLPEKEVRFITGDPGGNIWMGFKETIGFYDINKGVRYTWSVTEDLMLDGMDYFFLDEQGKNLLLVSGGNLFTLDTTVLLARHRQAPRVFLEDFRMNNTSYFSDLSLPGPGKTDFSYRENTLELSFISPSINEAGKVVYSYRLSHTGTWSAPSKNNKIVLPRLQAGSYRVEVRASADGAHWSEKPLSLSFTIHPPFWDTWWFRLLVAVSVAAGIVLLVRYISTRKMKERILLLEKEQAIEKERNRLSKDMHDDLGSGLTKISILSEVAKQKANTGAPAADYLDSISNSSRELVKSLNNIVWSLNPENDSLKALVAYIREYSAQFLEGCQVTYTLDVADIEGEIRVNEQVKRNVFLVVKEALNNAVKHGRPTEVSLVIESPAPGEVSIIITDNGKGMDPEKIRYGNGLRNMEKRMQDIGGYWKMIHPETGGTRIMVGCKVLV